MSDLPECICSDGDCDDCRRERAAAGVAQPPCDGGCNLADPYVDDRCIVDRYHQIIGELTQPEALRLVQGALRVLAEKSSSDDVNVIAYVTTTKRIDP